MKKFLFVVSVLTSAALICSDNVFAQIPASPLAPSVRVPRVSQGAKVSQVIGLSEATIYYHRPGVKGREIWGKLLPYDQVWRAGANEPTLVSFTDNVTIGGKSLSAGTYRFLVIPSLGDWTVIFNSEVRNWGTVYEEKYDTLKFKVKPEAGPHEEWLSFSFADLTPTSATVVLAWEKIRIPFKIEFNTLGKLQSSVGTWQVLNSAARFALDNNVYFKEAVEWADRALAMNKNASTLRTKAELLAKSGNKAEAISAGEESLKMFKAMDQSRMSDFQKQQVADFEKIVAGWKK
ncbi:MAG TPA: hypothetical protein DCP63_04105 [Bacteroidetes bacterium]|nr:hypothetical protein [Bacteroidota bacterium]